MIIFLTIIGCSGPVDDYKKTLSNNDLNKVLDKINTNVNMIGNDLVWLFNERVNGLDHNLIFDMDQKVNETLEIVRKTKENLKALDLEDKGVKEANEKLITALNQYEEVLLFSEAIIGDTKEYEDFLVLYYEAIEDFTKQLNNISNNKVDSRELSQTYAIEFSGLVDTQKNIFDKINQMDGKDFYLSETYIANLELFLEEIHSLIMDLETLTLVTEKDQEFNLDFIELFKSMERLLVHILSHVELISDLNYKYKDIDVQFETKIQSIQQIIEEWKELIL
jgi:hypothetical protein